MPKRRKNAVTSKLVVNLLFWFWFVFAWWCIKRFWKVAVLWLFLIAAVQDLQLRVTLLYMVQNNWFNLAGIPLVFLQLDEIFLARENVHFLCTPLPVLFYQQVWIYKVKSHPSSSPHIHRHTWKKMVLGNVRMLYINIFKMN